ncbi:MAG: hypothetical protein RL391_462 [Actinomycetota bacterium]
MNRVRCLFLAVLAAWTITGGGARTVSASTAPTIPNSTIPASCEIPLAVRVTFVGVVIGSDSRTARFEIRQVRGGSAEGFTAGGLIDVDYGEDVRFLSSGEEYIVAAGVDQTTGRLISKVRDPEPLFGGNQVIGIGEQNVDCPEFEDSVRTLTTDGRSLESGVLAPLGDDSQGLLRAVLLPFVWVLGGLMALAAMANVFRLVAAQVRASWNGEPVSRRRARPRP